MKTIFFNSPIGTDKLKFIVSDLSVATLKEEDIIPKKSATLVHDLITDDSPIELTTITTFPERCTFDDYKKPTKVIIDMELVNSFVVSQIRGGRDKTLEQLDNIQVRYLASGNADKVAAIEADKQILRDIPDTLDFSKATNFAEAMMVGDIPALTEDYKVKYA